MKFACLSAALLLAACTHKQEAVNTAPPPAPPPHGAMAPAPVTSSIMPGSGRRPARQCRRHGSFRLQRVQRRGQRQGHRWAARPPGCRNIRRVRVTIEGHADERGTREYNLALGARRANAVKEYLVSQGVSAGRVETVSYGKERPICTESNEACWAQNRRGVTTVTGGANS